MIDIQVQMCERAIELLVLPEDQSCLLLDIGCGSGLSGSVLEEQGHVWIGVDISSAMLGKYVNIYNNYNTIYLLNYVSRIFLCVYSVKHTYKVVIITYYFSEVATERETDGDLILGDMGQGLPFRAGAFDGAVSISALQWLCYADKASHNPTKRLYRFFSSLFACLSRSARAVLQFYPENAEQVELITAQATKAGFFGGVVVDFPNSTKAKKMFLVLMTGGAVPLPKALGTESEDRQTVANSRRFEY